MSSVSSDKLLEAAGDDSGLDEDGNVKHEVYIDLIHEKKATASETVDIFAEFARYRQPEFARYRDRGSAGGAGAGGGGSGSVTAHPKSDDNNSDAAAAGSAATDCAAGATTASKSSSSSSSNSKSKSKENATQAPLLYQLKLLL